MYSTPRQAKSTNLVSITALEAVAVGWPAARPCIKGIEKGCSHEREMSVDHRLANRIRVWMRAICTHLTAREVQVDERTRFYVEVTWHGCPNEGHAVPPKDTYALKL